MYEKKSSSLIDTISNKNKKRIPIWLMRQAGRYLPEYRKIRDKEESFLSMCLNPKLASEITLQPLRRYDLDAAIVFSDILTIPLALGKKVEFKENIGPKIETVRNKKEVERLEFKRREFLEPVYETLEIVKRKKPKECALIGFAGAPFTLAAYMTQGSSERNFAKCVSFFNKEESGFLLLLDKLADLTALHLINQIKSGAEVIQIFDSHAKIAAENNKLRDFCINPVEKIIERVRKETRNSYIICFPRNIGKNYIEYAANLELNCISLDQNVDRRWAVENIKPKNQIRCYQGNLDPKILVKENEIKQKLSTIFNKNILFLKSKDVKVPLHEIDFLEKIEVKKKYPNTIVIKLHETKPIAILFKQDDKYLLDNLSNLISFEKNISTNNLPSIFGEGAEKDFINFSDQLEINNFPKQRIKNYYYFQIVRYFHLKYFLFL